MAFEEHIIGTTTQNKHVDEGFQTGTSGTGDYDIIELHRLPCNNTDGKPLPSDAVLYKMSGTGNEIVGPQIIVWTEDDWDSYYWKVYSPDTVYHCCDISLSGDKIGILHKFYRTVNVRVYERNGLTGNDTEWDFVTDREIWNGTMVAGVYSYDLNIISQRYSGSPDIGTIKWDDNENNFFISIRMGSKFIGYGSFIMLVKYNFNGSNILFVNKNTFHYNSSLASSVGQQTPPDGYLSEPLSNSNGDGLTNVNTSNGRNNYSPHYEILNSGSGVFPIDLYYGSGSLNALVGQDYNDKYPPITLYHYEETSHAEMVPKINDVKSVAIGTATNDTLLSFSAEFANGSATKRILYAYEIENLDGGDPNPSLSSRWPIKINGHYVSLQEYALRQIQLIGNDGKTAIIKLWHGGDFALNNTSLNAANYPDEESLILLTSLNGTTPISSMNYEAKFLKINNNKNYYSPLTISDNADRMLMTCGSTRFRKKSIFGKDIRAADSILNDKDYNETVSTDSGSDLGFAAGTTYYDLDNNSGDFTYANNPKTQAALRYGIVKITP